MPTQTFPITGPINLVARIGHGSFRLTAVDGLTEATVTLTARHASSDVLEHVTAELNGRTLQVMSPRQGGIFDMFRGGKRDALDVEVTVPSGTALKITSALADVTATGRCGSADLTSGASNIVADYVDGDLKLRIGRGNCHIGRVSGAVHVRSGSGGATLDAVNDDVDIATGNGAVRLGIAAGVSARLDLVTGSGQVDSQLPVSSSASGSGRAITIRARTGSGDVHLFRAA